MNNEIFQLLRSDDPEDRKKAVRSMAQLRDREVLRYLATIYKEDPDPEVRDLAVRAGRHVKKQIEAGDWMVESSGPSGDEPARPAKSKPSLSAADEMNQTRARDLMDKAMDASVRLDNNTARKLAQQAFTLNPKLQDDPYYTNLAAEIMGMPVEEAVHALLSGAEAAAPSGGKRKRKNDELAAPQDVSWSDALMDVGIYGLIIAGITFLSMLFMVTVYSNLFASLAQQPELYGTDAYMYTQIARTASGMGFGIGLIYAVIAGVSAIIGYMFWGGVIHLVATMMLGGTGTYRGVLHAMFMPSAAQILIASLLSVVGVFFVFSAFPSDPALWATSVESEAALNQFRGAVGFFNIITLVNVLLWGGFVYWLSKAIGQNYDFGTGRGCASIIVGYVSIVIISCGCYYIFLTTIFSSMYAGM